MTELTIPRRLLLVRSIAKIDASLEQHFWHWALALLLLLLACSVANDIRAKMWFDELLTLHVAEQPSFGEIVKAIREGCDGSPPLYAAMVHSILPVVRYDALAARLPATLGYCGMLLCTLAFCRRRLPAAYAFIAALLVYYVCFRYATEGRPYGMVLGFAAGALLCWQMAVEGRRRGLAIPMLATSLTLMVALHYYAIFFLVPLFLAEVFRARDSGRLDFKILGAMIPAVLILALHYPLIAAGKPFLAHFWSPASWRMVEAFYDSYLLPMLLLYSLALVILAIFPKVPAYEAALESGIPPHEWVACGALTLMPLLVIAVSIYTTHVFVDRYILWAVMGLAIVCGGLVCKIVHHQAVVGLILLGVLMGALARQELSSLRQPALFRESKALHPELEMLPDSPEPILVPYAHAFLELDYYEKNGLRERLIYPASTSLDGRYLGYDTDARLLIALSHRMKARIRDYDAVFAKYHHFILAAMPGDYLTWRLLNAGYRVTPITSADRQPVIFRVELQKQSEVTEHMDAERAH